MDNTKRAFINRWLETINPSFNSKFTAKKIYAADTHLLVAPVKRLCTRTGSMTSINSPPHTQSATTATSSSSNRRQQALCPYRVKANLKNTTPHVTYLHESCELVPDAAKDVLTFLVNDDDTWVPEEEDVAKLLKASQKCTADMCNACSWLIDLIQPLLRTAIDDLSLEVWSVQTDTVDPKYQPRSISRDSYNRKISLVVGLPVNKWSSRYNAISAAMPDQAMNHIAHVHTGSRLLGVGVEVKAPDGNQVEAEVQLGIWMTGLVLWMWERQNKIVSPPPVVGCICIGDRWEFYIIYGLEGPDSMLSEVCVWGPLADLSCRTSSHRSTSILLKRLKRLFQYVCGEYIDTLSSSIVPSPGLEDVRSG
ncbi:hypothetical protein BDV25DRAFT_142949 [Aspergillus avenaceus]|uniref:PD-(D/E)XK nuclease-like domain-containing protein n=1 Tax=Aspergillus avenaceus TaxID=36643 RepID=A0A5N6TLL3_ASPAV|nr:hypothetical protein BDV25DRAFT_142949 [Aspergillus avenaceus]